MDSGRCFTCVEIHLFCTLHNRVYCTFSITDLRHLSWMVSVTIAHTSIWQSRPGYISRTLLWTVIDLLQVKLQYFDPKRDTKLLGILPNRLFATFSIHRATNHEQPVEGSTVCAEQINTLFYTMGTTLYCRQLWQRGTKLQYVAAGTTIKHFTITLLPQICYHSHRCHLGLVS